MEAMLRRIQALCRRSVEMSLHWLLSWWLLLLRVARRKRRRCPKEAPPPAQDFTPQEALLGPPLAEPSGTVPPTAYPPDADVKGFPSGLQLGCYLRLSRAQ